MGKNRLSLLLIVIPFFVNAQTNILGGIFENTTWSPSGNPYVATGNIVVFEDVTLTIEPGVVIRFNAGGSLEIRGKLIAIGNVQDSIHFTSNQIEPERNSWKGIIVKGTNGQTGDGNQVTMEYCVGKYANYFIDLDIAYEGPYVFRHCHFAYNNQTNKDGGKPETIFENCTFDYNIQALGGHQLKVINCEFKSNEFGVGGADLVESCYFSNNDVAVLVNKVINNCTIVENNIGVDAAFNAVNHTFTNNIIKNNVLGIRMQKYFNGSVTFTDNIICDNSNYNLEFLDFNNADIPFNCWCSEDSAFIRSTILDGYVNSNYGLVRFTPQADDCPGLEVNVETLPNSDDSATTVFPNPFSDVINVIINRPLDCEFSIYNLQGQRVLNSLVSTSTILNTDQLSTGLFIYEIRTKENILAKGKILKVE